MAHSRTFTRAPGNYSGGGITVQVEKNDLANLMKVFEILEQKAARKYMVSVFRECSKPLIAAARATAPVSKKKVVTSYHRHYTRKLGTHIKEVDHKPGDLRKSIKGYVGKSKAGSYWVGPQAGAGKSPNAYYGGMVHGGTKRMPANPFMIKAWEATKSTIQASIRAKLEKDIKEYLQAKVRMH